MPNGLKVIAGENVGVDHPSERLRNEPPICCVALFLRRDAERTEHRPAISGFVPALLGVARKNAPVHVAMPARNTERDPLVEVVLGCPTRRRVHCPDQMELSLRVLLI